MLFLALWAAIAWWAAAPGLTTFGFFLLLLPPFAASHLIGRWRYERHAPAGGLGAALVLSVVILDLSLAGIILAGRAGEPESYPSLRIALSAMAFWVGLADLLGLVSGWVGWLSGRD